MSCLWAQSQCSNVTVPTEAIILSRHHPYRRLARTFDGTREVRGPPPPVQAYEVIERAEQRVQWLENGGRVGSRGDPVHEHGIKWKSVLFSLPSWEVYSQS